MRARGEISVAGLALVALWGLPCAASARPGAAAPASVDGLPVVLVPRGVYRPMYPPARGVERITVPAFQLMSRPVTNQEFLAFVLASPEYRRDRIAPLFADEHYLSHWSAADRLGPNVRAAQPVTHVSWFAARAFCADHGMRLPTEAEWELAAAASPTRRDGASSPTFRKQVLAWYAAPNSELPDVPHGEANVYGVHDLHGVIWEWVEDFNNPSAATDSRRQGDVTSNRFCGGGALLATDTLDYATFMRLAMRSSLQARYATSTLGFRCAADAGPARATGRRPR